MAGLRDYQFEISVDTIYELNKFEDNFNFENSNIFVDGNDTGRVSIYTSEETPASKADMVLEHTNIYGHKSFLTIPNYIYIEVSAATVDKIIITGIKPTEV
jgi:hypothetical protein